MFEPKELEDGKVDRGVEPETALVWTEGTVKLCVGQLVARIGSLPLRYSTNLNTVSSVHLRLALVVLPHNTELNDTLGNLHNI